MNRFVTFGAVVLMLAVFGAPAAAQQIPSGAQPTGSRLGRDLMTQEQFDKLGDYADAARRLTKEDKAKGKTLKDLLAEDFANASALARAMPLSCVVTGAILAAEGPATVNGKTVDTKTYETACANGMGYFLISQDPGKPYGFSCFAADATRTADVAAGRQPGAVCKLPPNTDVKAIATAVLNQLGVNCAVLNYRWIGTNSKTNTEYNEIACLDGKGYVLLTALPGSMAATRVVDCHRAGMQGLPCTLTKDDTPVLTLQTFKDALSAHQVACTASDDKIRVIGQETTAKKRYVVEFQCAEQPKGLVALIPPAGSTAPFVTLDCAAAAKNGVACKLTATN